MPARNTIYQGDISASASPDGWRYHVDIHPCHYESFLVPEFEQLPEDFIDELPPIEHKSDRVPVGYFDGAGMSAKVNLGTVVGNALYGYLTDDGVLIDYNLNASTVWIISSDRGDAELELDEYAIEFIGVQRHYVGNKIEGDSDADLVAEIELVDIAKVVLETIPIFEAGIPPWQSGTTRSYYTLEDRLRFNITSMGGGVGVYTVEYFKNLYALLYQDSGSPYGVSNYGVVHHLAETDKAHEYVLVKWNDVVSAMALVAGSLFQKLIRRTGSATWDYLPGVASGSESAIDNVTLYRQGLTQNAERGAALTPPELKICAWVREDKGTTSWDDQEIFGGALYGENVVAKEYKNLWDWYRDITENAFARGVSTYTRSGNSYTMRILTDSVFSATVADSPNIGSKERLTKPVFLRGGEAGTICRATSNIADPGSENEPKQETPVLSLPQSLKHYNTRFALSNHPYVPDKDDFYAYLYEGTSTIPEFVTANTDGLNVNKSYILGTNSVDLSSFFYVEEDSGFSDPIALRAHHTVTFNLEGMAGTYDVPDGEEFELPTWQRLNLPGSAKKHFEEFQKAMLAALFEIERRSWPAKLAHTMASIFGRSSQRITELTLSRNEYHFIVNGLLSYITFRPDELITLTTNTTTKAAIVELIQDTHNGTDKVSLFNFDANI